MVLGVSLSEPPVQTYNYNYILYLRFAISPYYHTESEVPTSRSL
jgi:hypothetical protein